jgi:hypothetical protein
MKKLLLALPVIFMAFPALATQNDYAVRIAVATQETILACQIRDDLDLLVKLGIRRGDFVTAFSDGDFTGSQIPWVSAFNAGGMFDFVAADLNTALAANGNRDIQILEQMCGD